MIAVITPWLDLHHLFPAYAEAVRGAHPIIIDTSEAGDGTLRHFALGLDGTYAHMPRAPFSYAAACNLGISIAARRGASVAVCLNNDVDGRPDWLADVARLPDGVLAGPELIQTSTAGQPHLYVAGWCVAATMATWEAVGGWDDRSYTGCYHEDVDLSWRAARAGVYAQSRPWALRHLGDTTSRVTPGAYDHHAANREVFAARVRAWAEEKRA